MRRRRGEEGGATTSAEKATCAEKEVLMEDTSPKQDTGAAQETGAARPECEEPWIGDLNELVQFADRGIVSRTLVDCPKVKLILFAMKTGQTISGHSAGMPATIHVLGGLGIIKVGETEYEGKPGSLFYLPAGMYHALTSTDDLVFLLDLFR
jgi:quercetin dioxygenase-like cupin family protein